MCIISAICFIPSSAGHHSCAHAGRHRHTHSHRRAVLTVPPKRPDLPEASKLICFGHKEGNRLPSHFWTPVLMYHIYTTHPAPPCHPPPHRCVKVRGQGCDRGHIWRTTIPLPAAVSSPPSSERPVTPTWLCTFSSSSLLTDVLPSSMVPSRSCTSDSSAWVLLRSLRRRFSTSKSRWPIWKPRESSCELGWQSSGQGPSSLEPGSLSSDPASTTHTVDHGQDLSPSQASAFSPAQQEWQQPHRPAVGIRCLAQSTTHSKGTTVGAAVMTVFTPWNDPSHPGSQCVPKHHLVRANTSGEALCWQKSGQQWPPRGRDWVIQEGHC